MRRRLRFLCGFAVRHYLLELPAVLGQMAALRLIRGELRNGIRVVDPTPQSRVRFSTMVGEALDLVATFDAVRFSRIEMHIRTIVNVAGIVVSAYQPAFKVCAVNLGCIVLDTCWDEIDNSQTR